MKSNVVPMSSACLSAKSPTRWWRVRAWFYARWNSLRVAWAFDKDNALVFSSGGDAAFEVVCKPDYLPVFLGKLVTIEPGKGAVLSCTRGKKEFDCALTAHQVWALRGAMTEALGVIQASVRAGLLLRDTPPASAQRDGAS